MRTLWIGLVLCLSLSGESALQAAPARPNILWISAEDTSPWFGFCGESFATTPNLDRLASDGVHYTNAFVSAPVCSPCRFAIITGAYATTYGTQRLRSQFAIPDAVKGFPTFLRQAGYFCTNNVKTDYNTSAEKRIVTESWDECSGKAHWRHRKPGQPFFAVFNLMETHQSKVFEDTPEPKLDAALRHDPARAPLPPYYPDTPSARRTMARVHDCITAMDAHAGRILAELEADGLRNDTIIFFWPDHGQGIPRGKRTLWDTGLQIPLVLWFPPKYRSLAPAAPGTKCDRLVSLVDLGPTVLSLLEIPAPAYMQGRAFLGPLAAPAREFIFAARDRVDEALDVSRAVRDRRYLYIRNFMPHLSWNQPETFSDQLDLRRDITRLAGEGKLGEAQLTYAAARKPLEALYDTQADPWQMHNLATDPARAAELQRLRSALRQEIIDTRDLGLMHEAEAARLGVGGQSPYEVTRRDDHYPIGRVLETAEMVGRPQVAAALVERLRDADATVRYWAAVALRAEGVAGGSPAVAALRHAMRDESPSVRIEAAGALVAAGDTAAVSVLAGALRDSDEHVRLHAARTLQLLGEKARPALPELRAALTGSKEMFFRWSVDGAIRGLTGEEPIKRRK